MKGVGVEIENDDDEKGGSESCSPVSASELASLTQDIYNADNNRVDGTLYQLNFQHRYTSGVDSPQPFFSRLDESIFQRQSYSMVSALEDTYEKSLEGLFDDDADDEIAYIENYVEQLIATNPMSLVLDFLSTKGCINSSDDARKAFIYELWFNTYPPNEVDISSKYRSGFQHVFLGELRGTTVLGFFNWLTFYLEEMQGRINYRGWIDYMKNPSMVSVSFDWLGIQAPIRSFFVGVSPEFDMALATVCALVRPERACPVVINNQTFTYQTYIIRHKRQLQLAAAFPIVPLHTAPPNATGSDFMG
ncbi:hypothetical protein C0Q70_07347 [Pomacea canaliculata]|uniref:Uridylate-specific endoribonuclease n=1 Tax=Pomacea canaliculata TaxID=400727 RepID=A0A2T7PET2_POMCA|nr:hypothetical protein C0Q70_07347 [Pomacea canaliculata]